MVHRRGRRPPYPLAGTADAGALLVLALPVVPGDEGHRGAMWSAAVRVTLGDVLRGPRVGNCQRPRDGHARGRGTILAAERFVEEIRGNRFGVSRGRAAAARAADCTVRDHCTATSDGANALTGKTTTRESREKTAHGGGGDVYARHAIRDNTPDIAFLQHLIEI